jgi:hypothetical protein
MNIIKASANQISLTTANNVYNSPIVFVSATATALITVASNTGTTLGTFTIPANQYLFVSKNPTDTIASNVAVFATSSAYRG